MDNSILALCILIPIGIALYVYALIRFKQQEKGLGLIGWTLAKEKNGN
jgi:hypothetical protein